MSDKDLRTSSDTLFIPTVTTSVVSDLKQQLTAGGVTTFIGTAVVNVPSLKCSAVQYLCARMSAGSGASYVDADPSSSSNTYCVDVTNGPNRKTCSPGLSLVCDLHIERSFSPSFPPMCAIFRPLVHVFLSSMLSKNDMEYIVHGAVNTIFHVVLRPPVYCCCSSSVSFYCSTSSYSASFYCSTSSSSSFYCSTSSFLNYHVSLRGF